MSLYDDLELLREQEYPMLKDEIYLDHAGTTLYAKSLMEGFTADMMSNLYGNPHSASSSSQSAGARIEDTRLRVLQFFNADPVDFDVVFVANATAGIKLVAESFRCLDSGGFHYAYHKDSHTSLVGVRELANSSRLFDDRLVDEFSANDSPGLINVFPDQSAAPELYAYPGQSNMDGRRLSLSWCEKIRSARPNSYVMLDAAASASTSPIDLSNAEAAPDFTVVSFNKVFGFPDLGALFVRKSSEDVLRKRKYFGGGTVDAVVASSSEEWHIPKRESLHESLEDGTLPIHSIMALDHAMRVHAKLFESMERISFHTTALAQKLYSVLKSMKHANGLIVCRMYSRHGEDDSQSYGPTVAFNLMNSQGAWVSNKDVARLATVRKIHLRTGTMCNPCGLAAAVELTPWEISRNYLSGVKCGSDNDVISGKPTGVIRTSLGAMSTMSDVYRFIAFIEEFFVEKEVAPTIEKPLVLVKQANLTVRGLTVYPIKSCGGYTIPPGIDWEIRPEGLAWDREWCFIHQGTGQVLSQKRYPKMALIRPDLKHDEGAMVVQYRRTLIRVPLGPDEPASETLVSKLLPSKVCGDTVTTTPVKGFETHNKFFSDVLGVSCYLARFPSGGAGQAARHAKSHLQKKGGTSPNPPATSGILSGLMSSVLRQKQVEKPNEEGGRQPILLSNESPILLVNADSLTALNATISQKGGKAADDRTFRANIVVGPPNSSPSSTSPPHQPQPYAEDNWSRISIGKGSYTMLGPCRRCNMVCVDQETAERHEEPFVSLAKTRRRNGGMWFGMHMCHDAAGGEKIDGGKAVIRFGDVVEVEKWVGDS